MTPRRRYLARVGRALRGAVHATARKLHLEAKDGARVNPALDDVNDHFHAAYDDARAHAERDEPVLIVLADELIVFRGRARTDVTFTPPVFHLLKSVAHAPVGIFAVLHPRPTSAIDDVVRERLLSVRRGLLASSDSIAQADVEPDASATLSKIIAASLEMVGRVLERGHCDSNELRVFARGVGPDLLRITEDATRVQLSALDAHVASQVTRMTEHERRTFQVVVTGDHQARARSLGMQYFERLLGERPGLEHRVTYGEGITDAAEAAKLVGTRRLDRAIAASFFADPKRLQRDVLGDAVEKLLRTFASKLDPASLGPAGADDPEEGKSAANHRVEE